MPCYGRQVGATPSVLVAAVRCGEVDTGRALVLVLAPALRLRGGVARGCGWRRAPQLDPQCLTHRQHQNCWRVD